MATSKEQCTETIGSMLRPSQEHRHRRARVLSRNRGYRYRCKGQSRREKTNVPRENSGPKRRIRIRRTTSTMSPPRIWRTQPRMGSRLLARSMTSSQPVQWCHSEAVLSRGLLVKVSAPADHKNKGSTQKSVRSEWDTPSSPHTGSSIRLLIALRKLSFFFISNIPLKCILVTCTFTCNTIHPPTASHRSAVDLLTSSQHS